MVSIMFFNSRMESEALSLTLNLIWYDWHQLVLLEEPRIQPGTATTTEVPAFFIYSLAKHSCHAIIFTSFINAHDLLSIHYGTQD